MPVQDEMLNNTGRWRRFALFSGQGWLDDLPSGYAALTNDVATIVAAPDTLPTISKIIADAGSLYAYAARQPQARPMTGRGTVYAITVQEDQRWVVRHYLRGGTVASWLHDRYLRWGIPRPARELMASETVRSMGILTPRVAGLAIYRSGPFYRADIATEEIVGGQDLATVLYEDRPLEGEKRLRAWHAAGRLMGALLEHGVWHPDLNLKNVLLRWTDGSMEAYLLDLDRCSFAADVRTTNGMLRRFERSVRKWEAATGRSRTPEEKRALESGYSRNREGMR